MVFERPHTRLPIPKAASTSTGMMGLGLGALGVKYETHLGGKTTVSIADAAGEEASVTLAGLNFKKPRRVADGHASTLTTPPPNGDGFAERNVGTIEKGG